MQPATTFHEYHYGLGWGVYLKDPYNKLLLRMYSNLNDIYAH